MRGGNAHQPAFPQPIAEEDMGTCGLTKRELFAALALQGLLADPDCGDFEGTARGAVLAADLLLEALDAEDES